MQSEADADWIAINCSGIWTLCVVPKHVTQRRKKWGDHRRYIIRGTIDIWTQWTADWLTDQLCYPWSHTSSMANENTLSTGVSKEGFP